MPGFLDPQLITEFPSITGLHKTLNSQRVFSSRHVLPFRLNLLGIPHHHESLIRLAGATFLILGIVLIRT
jgi:hypothetical protein